MKLRIWMQMEMFTFSQIEIIQVILQFKMILPMINLRIKKYSCRFLIFIFRMKEISHEVADSTCCYVPTYYHVTEMYMKCYDDHFDAFEKILLCWAF